MWGPVYVEEKLHEFRQEEQARRERRGLTTEARERKPRRAAADRLGGALVRLGTRLQAWAQGKGRDADLAGAED